MGVAQFKIDMAEVRSLAHEISGVDSRLTRHIIPVVKKGAVNIKSSMQADLRGSSDLGFKAVANTVSFDMIDDGFGAEIGPGAGGELENIAYFGSYKGGGTVRDPWHALDEEYPNFVKHLEDVAESLVLG